MRLLNAIKKHPIAYALVFPAFIYSLIYGYLTMPYMIMAFQRFSYRTTIFTADWLGFKNFEYFFTSRNAWVVTRNTLGLNFLFILFTAITALFLALVLSQIRWRRFVKVTQSTFIFPHFVSWVIASYIIYGFFATQQGMVNNFLQSLGLEGRNWYTDPAPWPAILTGLRVWKGAGMQTVIYLAAITSIDPQLYEAAYMDGAKDITCIRYITLPLVLPVACILALLAIGRMFYGDFAMIYAIIRDNGLLYPTTDVIDTYVFRSLRLTGNTAQAMAVGLYQSIVGFILVYGSNRFVRRFFPEGALF